MSENDFECFGSTGVNAPVAMFPNAVRFNFFETETLRRNRWRALWRFQPHNRTRVPDIQQVLPGSINTGEPAESNL